MLDNFRVRLAGLGPAALRLALGVIFIYHGWPKFQTLALNQGRLAFIEELVGSWPLLGPHAYWVGWAVALTEFAGGLCLILGLLTRFWSAGLVVNMAVAVLAVHWKDGFSVANGGFEYPLSLGLMALGLFLLGPGPLSLDHGLGRLFRGGRANSVVGCAARYSPAPAPPGPPPSGPV